MSKDLETESNVMFVYILRKGRGYLYDRQQLVIFTEAKIKPLLGIKFVSLLTKCSSFICTSTFTLLKQRLRTHTNIELLSFERPEHNCGHIGYNRGGVYGDQCSS